MSFALRFSPIFDLEAIFMGAVEWTETGTFGNYFSSSCYKDYFYIFPNNTGSMAFLAVVFKIASSIGIQDFFMVAACLNAIMSVLTMTISILICKKIFTTEAAVMAMVFFLLSPPFYFIAPVFYTDSLSMLFPVAAFYLFLIAMETTGKIKKLLLFSAVGLIIAIGALIKATVLIAAIAILIYLALKSTPKRFFAFALTLLIVVSTVFSAFNAYIYSCHLDKNKAEQMNTPYSYWFSLAFQGNGGYNNECFSLSRSIKDPELRKKELNRVTVQNIEKLGLAGMIKLFQNKSARAFGDGTYALSDFLDDNPQEKNFLHDFLLYKGKYYSLYSVICSGIFLTLLILMLFSVRVKEDNKKCFIPQLCVFGIMFFLLFWEINSRYITNFIPMIFICAAFGITRLYEGPLKKIMEKHSARRAPTDLR